MNTLPSIDLFDETEATSSVTMNATTSRPTSASSDQSMKSQRKKSSAISDPPKHLAPLIFGHDRSASLIEQIEPSRRRDDLVLSPRNIGIFVGLIEEYRRADTFRRHGLPVRTKLLFCGPPGCGKTVTAEVFAYELGLPLFVARLDAIISSFLGETASNLRKLFDEVNRRPCVLFLDEFDALARARRDVSEHNELRRVVNSLLMMIDRYQGRGFLIAATNLDESLDPAVWRRFDEVIFFGPPQDRQIQKMVELKTRNFPASFDVREKLAKLRGLSFADIERVCFNAIKRSILKNSRTIADPDFNISIREERRRQAIRNHLATGAD